MFHNPGTTKSPWNTPARDALGSKEAGRGIVCAILAPIEAEYDNVPVTHYVQDARIAVGGQRHRLEPFAGSLTLPFDAIDG